MAETTPYVTVSAVIRSAMFTIPDIGVHVPDISVHVPDISVHEHATSPFTMTRYRRSRWREIRNTEDEEYPTSLNDDSYICWGAGDDSIAVARSSFTCGQVTIDAFDYNGYWFEMGGQQGEDALYGGDGQDQLCGSLDGDELYGWGDVDFLDGIEGADKLRAGEGNDESWGGAGDDNMFDYGASSYDFLRGESGEDCLYDDTGAGTDEIDCSGPGPPEADTSLNSCSVTVNCEDCGESSCP